MEQSKDNWKVTTMIIGGVVGLICGIVAAYILIQRAEEEESRPRISAGEGVKSGTGSFRFAAPGFGYAHQTLIPDIWLRSFQVFRKDRSFFYDYLWIPLLFCVT